MRLCFVRLCFVIVSPSCMGVSTASEWALGACKCVLQQRQGISTGLASSVSACKCACARNQVAGHCVLQGKGAQPLCGYRARGRCVVKGQGGHCVVTGKGGTVATVCHIKVSPLPLSQRARASSALLPCSASRARAPAIHIHSEISVAPGFWMCPCAMFSGEHRAPASIAP